TPIPPKFSPAIAGKASMAANKEAFAKLFIDFLAEIYLKYIIKRVKLNTSLFAYHRLPVQETRTRKPPSSKTA
ncbi:hypothetical protein, partial [Hallerella succinigenes]|uniref:hypothetical protein n=1 Tax=Hallerella succinigenes TaxID=1896222 RepID=UPI002A7F2FEC